MTAFLGALIRRERLRQSWSQEGLCGGICAVSYLSKIEQGKVQAGDDILLPLLRRLGIEYETDPAFLARAGALVETLYEDMYSGLSLFSLPEGHLLPLEEHRRRLLASPYMLDTLLLESLFRQRAPAPSLREFIPCMTRRQYEIHLLLQFLEDGGQTADELLRLNPCGFYTCQVGIRQYQEGQYLEAAELLGRAYGLAAQEGNVHLMCTAKLYLGNCCCDTGQLDLMRSHYQVARKLAAALGNPARLTDDIDYNQGCSCVEFGLVEEGYALLRTLERGDALYYHKLAIAQEKLGEREEALRTLEKARTAQVDGPMEGLIGEMLALVEYRLLHPDYLRDGVYAALMTGAFDHIRCTLPSGFARFHLPYMLEVLEAERRYREAYRLVLAFSNISAG